MVTFVCEVCGDEVPRKRCAQHQRHCRGAFFTCLDCGKTFYGDDWKKHTSCVTESEKYEKGYRKKKERRRDPVIQSLIEDGSDSVSSGSASDSQDLLKRARTKVKHKHHHHHDDDEDEDDESVPKHRHKHKHEHKHKHKHRHDVDDDDDDSSSDDRKTKTSREKAKIAKEKASRERSAKAKAKAKAAKERAKDREKIKAKARQSLIGSMGGSNIDLEAKEEETITLYKVFKKLQENKVFDSKSEFLKTFKIKLNKDGTVVLCL